MKLSIILSTSNPRICWKALQLGVVAQKEHGDVNVFLVGRGLDPEGEETEKFDVLGATRQFLNAGGSIRTGRQVRSNSVCPLSPMGGLHQILEVSDKVLMF